MKMSLLLFLAVLYTPIFGGLFIPHNIKLNLAKLLTMMLLILSAKFKINRYFVKRIKPIFQFCVFFLFLDLLQLIYKGVDIRRIIDYQTIYLIPITLVLFLSHYKNNSIIKFLENVFYLVGVMFLLQFILSAYESINNIYLDPIHNWALNHITSHSIRSKWLLQVIGIDFSLLDRFIHPFSGLLGQSNFWAVQLPFYNLIFLYMHYKTRRKYFMLLVVLVFSAILLNTTRSAIFIILVTDIFYMLFIGESKRFNYVTIGGVVILLFIYIGDIVYNFIIYFEQSDSLTGRLATYNTLSQFSMLSEIPLIWGYSVPQILNIEYVYLGGMGFESYFFDVLFYNGIFGFLLFIYLLMKILKQGRKFSTINKYFSFLIVMNIIGISLTINGPVTDYAFSFVTILYIYNVVSDRSYNESRINMVKNIYNKNRFIT